MLSERLAGEEVFVMAVIQVRNVLSIGLMSFIADFLQCHSVYFIAFVFYLLLSSAYCCCFYVPANN